MQKEHLKLTDAEREALTALLAKGSLKAKVFKRATALLELDRGKSLQAVAATLGVTYVTVANWRDNYHEVGLQCLHDKARSGRPIVITGKQRAQVTALACGCWRTKSSNWVTATVFRTPMPATFSKKRIKTAPQTNLVYWPTQRAVPGANGTALVVVCFAL
jgi:hypothetical protein